MSETVRCADCGAEYAGLGLDLVLPDQQWNVIAPDANILCANCICKRAAKHGGTVVMAWIDNMNYDPAPAQSWQDALNRAKAELIRAGLIEYAARIRQIEKDIPNPPESPDT